MALDDRDFQSYNLPESTKQRNLEGIQQRFEEALPLRRKPFELRIPLPETKCGSVLACAIAALILFAVLWYIA